MKFSWLCCIIAFPVNCGTRSQIAHFCSFLPVQVLKWKNIPFLPEKTWESWIVPHLGRKYVLLLYRSYRKLKKMWPVHFLSHCSLKYSIRQPCWSLWINKYHEHFDPKKEALELSPTENLFLANTIKMLGEFISIYYIIFYVGSEIELYNPSVGDICINEWVNTVIWINPFNFKLCISQFLLHIFFYSSFIVFFTSHYFYVNFS